MWNKEMLLGNKDVKLTYVDHLIMDLSNGQMLFGDMETLSHFSFGCKNAVEIGTARGFSAMVIATKAKSVTTIDSYNGQTEEAGRKYFEVVQKYLPLFNPNIEAIKQDSKDVVHRFTNDSIDFLYIDGDHDAGAISSDYISWLPKVMPGGYILFHDYCVEKHPHVVHFVDNFVMKDKNVKAVEFGTRGITIIKVFRKI